MSKLDKLWIQIINKKKKNLGRSVWPGLDKVSPDVTQYDTGI